jgi:hypothetical protein
MDALSQSLSLNPYHSRTHALTHSRTHSLTQSTHNQTATGVPTGRPSGRTAWMRILTGSMVVGSLRCSAQDWAGSLALASRSMFTVDARDVRRWTESVKQPDCMHSKQPSTQMQRQPTEECQILRAPNNQQHIDCRCR